MRGISEITDEIEKLKSDWKNYTDLEKLDLLERTLARYAEPEQKHSYARAAAPADADFRTLAYTVPVDGLISVMGTHMDVIEKIYPKEYDMIMRQLREL